MAMENTIDMKGICVLLTKGRGKNISGLKCFNPD